MFSDDNTSHLALIKNKQTSKQNHRFKFPNVETKKHIKNQIFMNFA